MAVVAFLALGANLGDPETQIRSAIEHLDAEGARIRRRARLYLSKPIGPAGQPPYLNTAVEIETALEPLDLLDVAKRVEAALGRTPGIRWGPRIIDVDLALYGDLEVSHPRLTIPHPEIGRRRFVLAPLADLAPELEVPSRGSVRELLARLDDDPEDLEVREDRVLDRGALGLDARVTSCTSASAGARDS